MNSVLKLVDVTKAYEGSIAVDNVSFEVPEGCIFGLLGPNGAGKTSLIRIITTIIRADSGVVFLNGEKLNSNHPSQIGYMPEERGLYKKMKVGEHLMYLARLKGLSKNEAKNSIDEWFEKFDITDWWKKKVEELSKGMQQKIQFIATVVHKPRLLILDEPFSGLDPINTNLIKDEINKMHNKGVSIIFSTHRMEQVEEICEKIVLINKGLNVLEGNVEQIKQQFKENVFEIEFENEVPEIPSDFEVSKHIPQGVRIKLRGSDASNQLLQTLISRGARIKSFNEILPTLNEIFIRQVESENAQTI